MYRRPELVRSSALGPLILATVLFAFALIMSEPPARATKSGVTIGGPFTLSIPDGTTVTDQTYRGKWLLVYFGYTFCPNSCATTLLEVATALKKLGPLAAEVQPLFITVDPGARHAEGDATIHSVVRSAYRRSHRHSAANRGSCPGIWGLLRARPEWTRCRRLRRGPQYISLRYGSLTANSSVPSTPTHQAIGSPTCCANSRARTS